MSRRRVNHVTGVASACGYASVDRVGDLESLDSVLGRLLAGQASGLAAAAPSMCEVEVLPGARPDLGARRAQRPR